MVDVVQFNDAPTPPVAPVTPDVAAAAPPQAVDQRPVEERLAELETRFKDTQAELTRKSQRLAELEKPPGETPKADDPAPKADGEKPKPVDNELEIKPADEALKADADAAELLQPFYQEYNETRTVSPESREKIASTLLKGLPKDQALALIDSYVNAAVIRDTNATNQIFAEAGGESAYRDMTAWAASNLQAGEQDAYNRAVNSGDFQAASLAVSGLRAKYERANGRSPKLIEGDNSVVGGGFYKSMAEVSADMANPIYRKNTPEGEVFRQKVRDKMARSGNI